MLQRCIIALLAAAVLLPLVPGQAQQPPAAPLGKQQEPVIRRGVDLVNVVFSVLNRRERFVTDLEKDDFRVLEDGREQHIRFFSRETDLPLRIGLLLDTSNSIRPRMEFQKAAASDFVYQMVRRGKDLLFLMIFDNDPFVIADFTDDTSKLIETIQRQRAGGGTALYDAVYKGCAEQLLYAPRPEGQNQEMRRVLVVISDGDDNLSRRTRREALDQCQRAEVAIYTISTSTDWQSPTAGKLHKTPGDRILEELAENTGGRAFFPYRADDLARSFQDISVELRSQYSLAYTPENRKLDGRFRRVKIEVNRRGLTVRARPGYFAPPENIPPSPPAPGR